MTFGQRIRDLEEKINKLKVKVYDLTNKTENRRMKSEGMVSQLNRPEIMPLDISAGYGGKKGSPLAWNDADMRRPPYKQQADEPKVGYNKHSHSRFAGGALDISTLELVEYDFTGIYENYNKHCQQFWPKDKIPPIKKDENGQEKIGLLEIQWDSDSQRWVTGSDTIDVERTYLVQYVWMKGGSEVPAGTPGATREIKKDSKGQEMKSPLLFSKGKDDENADKSNIIWDEEAECWRFYAVFKPYPVEEE